MALTVRIFNDLIKKSRGRQFWRCLIYWFHTVPTPGRLLCTHLDFPLILAHCLHAAHLGTNQTPLPKPFLPVRLCCGLSCVPPEGMLKSYPGTSECDLIGKQSLYRCNQVKMRSCWITTGPHPMTGVLLRREETQRDTETVPCDNRGQDWSDVSAS